MKGKTPIRPSTQPRERFCERCNYPTSFFMTNQEFWDNSEIQAVCQGCNKFSRMVSHPS